tara:strand:+ start:2750 stop:3226 length:477 start_codon:yes stop_codon:yes gene_type:complete
MSKDNQVKDTLSLWNKVSKSDPKYLKKVSFGSRSFTAIDPQYQVRSATEAFGPIGHGWGWSSNTRFVDVSNGDTAVIADVMIWTVNRDNCFGPFSGCRKFFDSAKGRMAEDAPKMAITDGLTKAMSHLGFNADVFLGEMDGNKYAADSKAGKKSVGEW